MKMGRIWGRNKRTQAAESQSPVLLKRLKQVIGIEPTSPAWEWRTARSTTETASATCLYGISLHSPAALTRWDAGATPPAQLRRERRWLKQLLCDGCRIHLTGSNVATNKSAITKSPNRSGTPDNRIYRIFRRLAGVSRNEMMNNTSAVELQMRQEKLEASQK